MQRILEQALKRIPTEPYPELRLVLERFVGGVQDAVKTNFVGAYLVGSLATGNFDHDSDIDFLIVTDEELTGVQVQALQALHLALHSLGCYPAQHLEASYVPRDLLNQADQVGTQPLGYIDNGSTVLERLLHDKDGRMLMRLDLRALPFAAIGSDLKACLRMRRYQVRYEPQHRC